MKIVIFGLGKFFENRKSKIPGELEVVCYLDNNHSLQGTLLDEIPVYAPEQIVEIEYDQIILMSAKAYEMREQLLNLGAAEEKIVLWNDFYGKYFQEQVKVYMLPGCPMQDKRSIMIVHPGLNYDGATMVIVYALQALMEKGHSVILVAADGNPVFIHEMTKLKVPIVIAPGILTVSYHELKENEQLKKFDMVLVNSNPMMRFASEISRIKPTVWWVHTPKYMQNRNVKEMPQYVQTDKLSHIHICAVSKVAADGLNYYVPNIVKDIIPYGIPDKAQSKQYKDGTGKKRLVFAIIGAIWELKGQYLFVQALQRLAPQYEDQYEAWIIGRPIETEYYEKFLSESQKIKNVKILGELNREALEEIYQEIDVVVCPSIEDSLPVVMTEAMMYRKVCIASDATGTRDYIEENKNGFICKAGDVDSLTEKIEFILKHKDQISMIGKNARKTYEKFFSMERFVENLEQEIDKTIRFWTAD